MKKGYMKPQMEVVVIERGLQLLPKLLEIEE